MQEDQSVLLELNDHTHLISELEARVDKVEQKQDDLDKIVSAFEVLSTKQETIEKDVGEIKSDVKLLTLKPAKLWDGLVEKIIFGIAGAVIAYLLAGGSIG